VVVTRFDQLEQASLTDVGVRRSHNQDNLAVALAGEESRWRQLGHLFLVADGMGGHAVGEKASEMAAAIIPHTYEKHANEGTPTALRKAFQEANASIHACGEANSEFRGMGTTSTALVLREDVAWIAHVGDSRAYRIRDGVIEQLTYDHSYIWEYARLKNIDPDDVQDFPSNVIHRCLGPQALVQVDVEGPHPVRSGDIFLLCSDGLSGQVDDHEMGVVASLLPPEEACRFLVDLANLRGGPDNITVLVVRVDGSPDRGPSARGSRTLRLVKPLWERVPWPILSLAGGVLLALVAIGLKFAWSDANLLAGLVFLLAAGPIVAGVGGLVVQHKQRGFRPPESDDTQEPRVYRSKPCRLDRPLLEKLSRAEQTLRQRAEEMQWAPDLATYEAHHARAEQLVKSADLPAAFREYCRAMRPLTAALHKHRSKEEVFQPVWDKST
jgi:PPM family protein phosphatase